MSGWQRAQAAKDPQRGTAGFAEGAGGFGDDDARYDMDEDEELHHSPIARRAAGAGEGDRSTDNFSPSPTRDAHARPNASLRGSSDREATREGGTFQGTPRRVPLTIEGELVAKSTGTVSPFSLGDRVFHQKFGNGNITAIDGNKLTIQFDRAGEKRVVDSFVERA
jgi:DNA helicase-2/ATP-dependent DNA helicase PcrA